MNEDLSSVPGLPGDSGLSPFPEGGEQGPGDRNLRLSCLSAELPRWSLTVQGTQICVSDRITVKRQLKNG